MRGCLAVLVLAALFSLGAAWVGGPSAAAFVISTAIDGSGFDAERSNVEVDADPPIEVLAGHADEVRIEAEGVAFRTVDAETLQLAFADVDLVGRRFGTVRGVLGGVTVEQATGVVPVRRIELSGPAGRADVLMTIDASVVEGRAIDAINDRIGLSIGGAELAAPDGIDLSVAGIGIVKATFVAEADGSLALAIPVIGNPRVVLVEGTPVRFSSAVVGSDGLLLRGTIDLEAAVR